MWYLYLGYVLIQFYPLIVKLQQVDIAPSALFFSLVVFLLWSFVPILGYIITKSFKAKVSLSKLSLFSLGAAVALIEHGLFYFNILHYKQHFVSTLVMFICFAIIAFMAKPVEPISN